MEKYRNFFIAMAATTYFGVSGASAENTLINDYYKSAATYSTLFSAPSQASSLCPQNTKKFIAIGHIKGKFYKIGKGKNRRIVFFPSVKILKGKNRLSQYAPVRDFMFRPNTKTEPDNTIVTFKCLDANNKALPIKKYIGFEGYNLAGSLSNNLSIFGIANSTNAFKYLISKGYTEENIFKKKFGIYGRIIVWNPHLRNAYSGKKDGFAVQVIFSSIKPISEFKIDEPVINLAWIRTKCYSIENNAEQWHQFSYQDQNLDNIIAGKKSGCENILNPDQQKLHSPLPKPRPKDLITIDPAKTPQTTNSKAAH